MSDRDLVMTDERLDSLERRTDDLERRFVEAFPGGDHVGHCRYHTLMIEQLHDRKRLIAAIKEKTISGLVWGGLVTIGASLWFWFLAKVKGG